MATDSNKLLLIARSHYNVNEILSVPTNTYNEFEYFRKLLYVNTSNLITSMTNQATDLRR